MSEHGRALAAAVARVVPGGPAPEPRFDRHMLARFLRGMTASDGQNTSASPLAESGRELRRALAKAVRGHGGTVASLPPDAGFAPGSRHDRAHARLGTFPLKNPLPSLATIAGSGEEPVASEVFAEAARATALLPASSGAKLPLDDEMAEGVRRQALFGMVNDRNSRDFGMPHHMRHGGTIPTGIIDGLTALFTTPGEVYRGEVETIDPETGRTSDALIRKGADMALNMMGGGLAATPLKPRGALGISGGRGRGGGKLPMDEASREARVKQMGYEEEMFYRGDQGMMNRGGDPAPSEYPSGGSWSRNPNYNQGGFGPNREFRLNLQKAIHAEEILTASQLARIIEAARKLDPRLASDIPGQWGKTPEWFLEFARRNPDHKAFEGGLLIQALKTSKAGDAILRHAGFDAISVGHEVRKLTGRGIRHRDAAFDPERALEHNIFYTGGSPLGATLGLPERED